MKRNLVIVRAGRQSLHHHWFDLPYSARDFDVIVSYFDEDAYNTHVPSDGVDATFVPGGKWDGIYKTVNEPDLAAYDYIWLPDDDLWISVEDINQTFAIAAEYRLKVAQPALTHDSYYSHFIFMQSPSFKLRYTNYIEIMAPCLDRHVFAAVLPHFAQSKSGYGLDYIWCRLPGAAHGPSAILDAVSMRHTRPVGGPLKQIMKAAGTTRPEDEEALLKARFGIAPHHRIAPIAYGGVTQGGQAVHGRLRVLCQMLRDIGASDGGWVADPPLRVSVMKLIRRQLTKPLDLSDLGTRTG
ncbi:hypothetical protein [Rhizobium sp. X9]|uniref:hypothetical protein n=1 Tax=Rhizobium sp. X9 TaxID=2815360 RepID=UPI001C0C53B3|nr:hypothetical protein [Rhizobium sp. X9]